MKMENENRSLEADLDAALLNIERLQTAMNALIDEMEMWSGEVQHAMPDNIFVPSFHLPSRERP
tara:strand:- start:20 stop:211 length:192 start_codon:yes stop_codon:yes gene_type:complete